MAENKKDFITRYYPEARCGGFTEVDGTIPFYLRINELIQPDSAVLDIGCGRAAYADDPVRIRRELRILKGKCKTVIGIDVDVAASDNPFLDRFRLIETEHWPVDDESVDLSVCDYVLEHIRDVPVFFGQAHRVLRKGGYLCIRTPNTLSYFVMASRLIPDGLHARVLSRVQDGRHEEDVFPKYYRCNRMGKLRKTLSEAGFDGVVWAHEAEPSYLAFSRWSYAFGVFLHRLLPRWLNSSLIAFGRKI